MSAVGRLKGDFISSPDCESDVEDFLKLVAVGCVFRVFGKNDHELQTGFGGGNFSCSSDADTAAVSDGAGISVNVKNSATRGSSRQDDGNSLLDGLFHARNHRRRKVAASEAFKDDALATTGNGEVDVFAIGARHGLDEVHSGGQGFRMEALDAKRLATEDDLVEVNVADRAPPGLLERGGIGGMSLRHFARSMERFIEADKDAHTDSFF